jgi:hypothetical protein
MKATNINSIGKKEKGKKIKEGDCIFPFKYQWKNHDDCIKTEKGDICATSVSERGTLKTYGYCNSRIKSNSKKGTVKKTLKKRKLKIVDSFTSNKSKSKTPEKMRSKSKTPEKEKKLIYDIDFLIDEKVESDLKPKSKNKIMNKELIDIMEELADIMVRQGEPFKGRAYKKASETIMAYPDDITDVKQLKGQPAIGKTIMDKLEVFQNTGTLPILERERKNPLNLFTKIYGVGPKKAKQLIDDGISSIEDLKNNETKLNDTQKMGLKYYDDLNERIPRSEIEYYNVIFEKKFKESTPEGSKYDIVGSFRREAKSSGDIDIIITNTNETENICVKFSLLKGIAWLFCIIHDFRIHRNW